MNRQCRYRLSQRIFWSKHTPLLAVMEGGECASCKLFHTPPPVRVHTLSIHPLQSTSLARLSCPVKQKPTIRAQPGDGCKRDLTPASPARKDLAGSQQASEAIEEPAPLVAEPIPTNRRRAMLPACIPRFGTHQPVGIQRTRARQHCRHSAG